MIIALIKMKQKEDTVVGGSESDGGGSAGIAVPASANTEEVVVLCIVDGGRRVRMPLAIAKQMNVLAALIGDCGEVEGGAAEVPIDNVSITSSTMKTIVDLLSGKCSGNYFVGNYMEMATRT